MNEQIALFVFMALNLLGIISVFYYLLKINLRAEQRSSEISVELYKISEKLDHLSLNFTNKIDELKRTQETLLGSMQTELYNTQKESSEKILAYFTDKIEELNQNHKTSITDIVNILNTINNDIKELKIRISKLEEPINIEELFSGNTHDRQNE